MKFYPLILAFVVFLAAAPCSVFGQERIWKDSTGSYTVQAELVDIVEGKVVLKKQNGNIIKVPLSVLSAEDQKFIQDLEKPKVDPITAPKSEPTTSDAAPPQMNELPSAGTNPDTESLNGPTTRDDPAVTEATEGQLDSITPPKVSLATRTRAFIRFDPTHFDFTDIPPRPKRPPTTSIVADDIPGAFEPESEPLTESTASGEASDLDANVIANQTDSSTAVASEIELTTDEVNLLPKQYSLIGKSLYSGADPGDIRGALDQLAKIWPASPNETILRLVRKSTACDEKFCRLKAIRLLGKYDFDDSLPYILARLDDDSFDIRWAVLELIGQSQDPRALQPVIERFNGPDRAKVSSILMLYGSQAELGLHQFLSHNRADVRMETSLLLGKLGSAESIPKLESLATTDENPIVALQARSAVRKIKKRLGLD